MADAPHHTVTVHDQTVGAQAKPPNAANSAVAVTDKKGRRIEVRSLNPIESYRLLKLTKATGLEGFFGMATMAATVRSIDGDPVGFPAKESEIEFMLQRLGNEGITAVVEALNAETEVETIDAPKP